jgi:hypothetical protein
MAEGTKQKEPFLKRLNSFVYRTFRMLFLTFLLAWFFLFYYVALRVVVRQNEIVSNQEVKSRPISPARSSLQHSGSTNMKSWLGFEAVQEGILT